MENRLVSMGIDIACLQDAAIRLNKGGLVIFS